MTAPHILLLGGDDSTYHDFELLLPILRGQLEQLGAAVTTSLDPDQFLPENICRYHLIVCYTLGHTLTAEQENGLLGAVEGNTVGDSSNTRGFLGIHGASCSFLNSAAYLRMLGGRFLEHPPLDQLQLRITRPHHPVTKGVDDFSLEDELYLIEPLSPFETLIHSEYEGSPWPVAWVKPYGLGKVCYLGLGHGADQLGHSSLQQIIRNAAGWILD